MLTDIRSTQWIHWKEEGRLSYRCIHGICGSKLLLELLWISDVLSQYRYDTQ